MHEDHLLVILWFCKVVNLRIDLRILMSEQVMTSSMVVPQAVYLNKKPHKMEKIFSIKPQIFC
jgi:hypothetical protein